jgi:hypothetical protein
VIENQVALEPDTPVRATLDRLMGEGLSRHDAVHAIGTVLGGHIYDMVQGHVAGADVNEEYFRQLAELTAESWLESGSTE